MTTQVLDPLRRISPASSVDGIADLLASVRRPLSRIFHHYRIAPSDAEDLIQDSLLILLIQWDQVKHPTRYLFGTVKLRIFNYLRRRALEQGTMVAGDPDEIPAHEMLSLLELRWDARRLLGRLSPVAQRVIALRFGADLRHREIAAIVGQSEASVRQILCRSLQRLKRDFEESKPL
ncbi:MAG TPA: sigma-70 family RNA polymerase sigma factor [Thermoanaerobaculia bacterium]|jgi:RNA polymerase sigma factor (sigma-70 family)|nr:sigma-70 family RNA polymerase sigma factor [Thermoanaerobaculia bacterium]